MQVSLLFLLLLCFAAVCDLKTQEIPDSVSLCIAAVGLVFCLENFMGIAVGGLLLLTAYFKTPFGGGDIKLIGASGLVLGFYLTVTALVLSLLLFIFYCFVRRIKGCAPFAPFWLATNLIILGGKFFHQLNPIAL